MRSLVLSVIAYGSFAGLAAALMCSPMVNGEMAAIVGLVVGLLMASSVAVALWVEQRAP